MASVRLSRCCIGFAMNGEKGLSAPRAAEPVHEDTEEVGRSKKSCAMSFIKVYWA